MNFMKKIYSIKIYVILSFIILLIFGIIVYLSISRKKDVYKFLTIPESYYLDDKYPTFNINLYSNHTNDYFLKEKTIKEISVKSYTSTDSYKLKLNQIREEDQGINNNNIDYYKYCLNVTFPVDINMNYQIKDAYLEIEYISDEILKFDIGSIIFYKELLDNKISIMCMKPIVNIIENKQIITGIGLTLSSNEDIIIENISSLDERLFFKLDQFKIIENNYNNNVLIEELLNEKYNPSLTKEKHNFIQLEKDSEKHFVIPIGYNRIESINTFGFIIEYEIDGIQHEQLVNPFKFFSGKINVKEICYARTYNK